MTRLYGWRMGEVHEESVSSLLTSRCVVLTFNSTLVNNIMVLNNKDNAQPVGTGLDRRSS